MRILFSIVAALSLAAGAAEILNNKSNCVEVRMRFSCDAVVDVNQKECRDSIRKNGKYLLCDSLRKSEIEKAKDTISYDTATDRSKCSKLPARLRNDCESSFLRGNLKYIASKSEISKELSLDKARSNSDARPTLESGSGYSKTCVHGIPCGGSCISASKTCRH